MHCKFNWFTVALDRTQNGLYIIRNLIGGILTELCLYMLNRLFNFAKLFVLHKLSFEYSSSSNLINTFDDLFRHQYMSPIYHMKPVHLLLLPYFLDPENCIKYYHCFGGAVAEHITCDIREINFF